MGPGPERFDPESLPAWLEQLGRIDTLYVAYSGGADSTALLLALHSLRDRLQARLHAVHVNHGAHDEAGDWADHCRQTCDRLGIAFTATAPPTEALTGAGPEARLRGWRLAALESLLGPHDVVSTAHHRDDQAETLLLALMRGSGPDGLAAMPGVRPLGAGRLARPLLDVPRQALANWLATRHVDPIEDPSNTDTGLDRNFLRHEILPALRRRWPAADAALATSASLCAEASSCMADWAGQALHVRQPAAGVLDLSGLDPQTDTRKHLVRAWLAQQGTAGLPRARLETLVKQLAMTDADSRVQVDWASHTLRHHDGRLWLDSPANVRCPDIDIWNGARPADLGPVCGRLEWLAGKARPFRITSRQGGERYRASPGSPSRALKQWFNTLGLPPWLRRTVPLLFVDQRLVAAGDWLFDEHLARTGCRLRWTPGDSALAWAWDECRRQRQPVK